MSWISRAIIGFVCGIAVSLAQTDRFSISGTVNDPSGAGVPGLEVALRGRAAKDSATVTDSSGTFRFPGLPAGRYEILVASRGFAAQKIPVRIADHSPAPLRIVLK